ncbi:hypothetical protein J6590_080011, partial [Homalodisca vitripennis]
HCLLVPVSLPASFMIGLQTQLQLVPPEAALSPSPSLSSSFFHDWTSNTITTWATRGSCLLVPISLPASFILGLQTQL